MEVRCEQIPGQVLHCKQGSQQEGDLTQKAKYLGFVKQNYPPFQRCAAALGQHVKATRMETGDRMSCSQELPADVTSPETLL